MTAGRDVDAARPKRRKTSSRRDRQCGPSNEDRNGRNGRLENQTEREAPQWTRGRSRAVEKAVKRTTFGNRKSSCVRSVGKMTALRTKQQEVDKNLEFFKERLPELLQTHRGKYALIRNQEIVGF